MARNGLNVPPGLTITTEVCTDFHTCGELRAPSPPPFPLLCRWG